MNGVVPYVVLGTAIGDALGKTFENKDAEYPPLVNWDGHTYLSGGFKNLGEAGLKAGAWTDDTQMTLALAQCIISHHAYNPVVVAEAYRNWYQGKGPSGACRGTGSTVRYAMDKLVSDLGNWRTASRDFKVGDIIGCGSAMRVAPLGVVYDKENILQFAELDANLTHKHPEGRAGSIAVALMTYYCRKMPKGTVPYDIMLSSVIKTLEEHGYKDTMTFKGLRLVQLMLEKSLYWKEAYTILGNSGKVWELVPMAFYCFLSRLKMAGDNVLEHADGVARGTYEVAIMGGGDTDSRAAVAGAFLGAFFGLEALIQFLPGVELFDTLQVMDMELYRTVKT